MSFVNFMKEAFECAKNAEKKGELPIGAVLVQTFTGKILAKAANATIITSNPMAHAEMIVLNEAILLGINRLEDYSLYTTLEPCQMCAGAIGLAKVGKLYIGCEDERFGAVLNNAKIFTNKSINHAPEIYSGIMEQECGDLLKKFFEAKR